MRFSYATLRYNLLLFTLLGIEGIWLSLLSFFLGSTVEGGALGWWPLLAVGVPLLAWNRWLLARGLMESGAGRIASFGGGALLLSLLIRGHWIEALVGIQHLFSEPVPFTVKAITGLLLWYRTSRIVQAPVGSLTTFTQIRWNAFLIVTLLLALTLRGVTPSGGVIFLFFALSLLALALARADEVSRQLKGSSLPLNSPWLATLGAGVAGVLLLALLVVPLAALVFRGVAALFAPVSPLLGQGLVAVLQLLAGVLIPFFEWINQGRDAQTIGPRPGPMANPGEAAQLAEQGSGLTETWLLYAMVALALLLLSAYLLRRQRRVAASRELDSDAAEFQRGEINWNLGAWLQQQATALRGRLTPAARRHFGTDTVHDLYKNLLLFGDEHGLARPLENTPYEYLAPLCQSYPQRRKDFLALTDAYVAAHYGERHFPPDEISALQEAWHRIASEPPRDLAQ